MSHDQKSLVDKVSNYLFTRTNDPHKPITNDQTITLNDISKRQTTKPCVSLQLVNDNEEIFNFEVLIDPASYKSSERSEDIISYIAKPLAIKIKNDFKNTTKTCNCKPATTCTPLGCFISSECLTVKCDLLDANARLNEIELSFRVVETLGDNDIVIGLTDVQKYDLTSIFRHLYVSREVTIEEDEEHVQKRTAHEIEDNLSKELQEGYGVEANGDTFSEAESDSETLYQGVRRREFIPPSLQAEIVNRGGARRNVPRRSSRLQGLSAIYRQVDEESRTQPLKSFTTLEMHAIEMIEGNIYDKEHFLDVEDDTDNIDQFVAETPHDKMFTHAVNFNDQDANLHPDHEQSHEPRS